MVIFLLTTAGTPTATLFDGIDFETMEFAPMITLSPMITPGSIVTLSPIHTLSPMTTAPFVYNGLFIGGSTKPLLNYHHENYLLLLLIYLEDNYFQF